MTPTREELESLVHEMAEALESARGPSCECYIRGIPPNVEWVECESCIETKAILARYRSAFQKEGETDG